MVQQLKIITGDKEALLGGGYVTANFNTPIIVKKGSKITMDKWYADLVPNLVNFQANQLVFKMNSNVKSVQTELTQISGSVPAGSFATIADYLATITASFNNILTSYYSTLAPESDNANGKARLYKFNRGLRISTALSGAPPAPNTPSTQALTITFDKTQFVETASTSLTIKVPAGVAQPYPTAKGVLSPFTAGGLQVGQHLTITTPDYLIQGGGLELALKYAFVAGQPIVIQMGLQNETDTKFLSIVVDCAVAEPEIDILYSNSVTAQTITVSTGYTSQTLVDPFLEQPYGSFRFYQINGDFKIRYEIPATKNTDAFFPQLCQVGATYVITEVGQMPNNELAWEQVTGLQGPFTVGQEFICVAVPTAGTLGAYVVVPFQVFDLDGGDFIGRSECTTEKWLGWADGEVTGAIPSLTGRLTGLYVGQPQLTEVGDAVQSCAGTFSQSPLIDDINYYATIQYDFTGTNSQLLGQLGIGTFAPLSTTNTNTGTYTGGQAVNFVPFSPNQELALEIVDLPLHSYTANTDRTGGARTNVVAYFIPQFLNGATQPSTRLSFTQGLYQWLYLDSMTDIQLTSLSFRVFYPYSTPLANNVFKATSMSFNILVEDGDQKDV